MKIWTATYLPFCDIRTTTGTPIEARFPGQWFQSESGLHQNWMRDYDPTTGRYIETDPLGLVDGASVYEYVGQNPGRWIDPRGENPVAVVTGVCEVFPGAYAKVVQMCIEGIAVGGVIAYDWWNEGDDAAPQCGDQCSAMAGHKKGKRPSTKGKHEEGDARRGKDQGGENGDEWPTTQTASGL